MSARDALYAAADGYAHGTFHDIATGGDVRVHLGGLFIDGFVLGAQLALVDPAVARGIIEEFAHTPRLVVAVANEVERIRSAGR